MARLFAPAGVLVAGLALAALALAAPALATDADTAAEGWIPLFDGHSLAGWRPAAESPSSFRVVDGTIACDGPRSHLFYVGGDGRASFEDFELSVEVKTKPGANSGVYFHTAYQDKDWPAQGFEVQVDNSQPRQGDYLEYKMTGSLYGIRNVYKALARDDEWFTMDVVVRRPRVQVRLDGTLVVDYREPGALPAGAPPLHRLGRGTFALQCHDPASKVFYRGLRVRPLTPLPAAEAGPPPVVDAAYLQVLELGKANFPTLDLHAHLKGGLSLDQVLELSRRTGMGFGVAINCGKGFAVQTDEDALAFLNALAGKPVFAAMQAEGREWVTMFSKQARARFDYVFTDSMTWTDSRGRRMRLWIPEEVDIGPDEQAFMEELVAQTVGILENEPIDVYVNATFLPAAIAARYDQLWTAARMRRVIDAAVQHGVAIEIGARYRLPSEAFLRLAKAAGVKFTFGTNNGGASDLGDWSYPLEMQRKLGLTWKDMFVPGHQPSRAQREQPAR
ncbi:MAG TPA: family 16 glycoside hydrolase [Vicinamibacteria bacterium]|nr:family 16 glycoside hydrolase [Vicinamibacteria bacterium]